MPATLLWSQLTTGPGTMTHSRRPQTIHWSKIAKGAGGSTARVRARQHPEDAQIPANQLKPCLCQKVSGNSFVTSIAMIHLAFLNPSFVAVRRRKGNPNGSVMDSRAYLVARIVCGCSAVAMSMLSV